MVVERRSKEDGFRRVVVTGSGSVPVIPIVLRWHPVVVVIVVLLFLLSALF